MILTLIILGGTMLFCGLMAFANYIFNSLESEEKDISEGN